MKRVHNPGPEFSFLHAGGVATLPSGDSEQDDDLALRAAVKFGQRGVCILPGGDLDAAARDNALDIHEAWDERDGAPAPAPVLVEPEKDAAPPGSVPPALTPPAPEASPVPPPVDEGGVKPAPVEVPAGEQPPADQPAPSEPLVTPPPEPPKE